MRINRIYKITSLINLVFLYIQVDSHNNQLLLECIRDTIKDNLFEGDKRPVSFFGQTEINGSRILHATASYDPLSVLKHIMTEASFSMYVFPNYIRPLSPLEPKRHFVSKMLIILIRSQDINSLHIIITCIRTLNIVDYDTKILLILEDSSELLQNIATEILGILWKYLKIINTTMLAIRGHQGVFYTNFPYSGNQAAVKINTCGRKYKERAGVYPEKLSKDLSGVSFRVGADVYPPHVFDPFDNKTTLKGSELMTIITVASHLNFSVSYKKSPHVDSRTTVVNNEFRGMFKLLHSQEVDVVCGLFAVSLERAQASVPLVFYFGESARFIAPIPRQTFPNWQCLLGSFSGEVWACFLVCCLGMTSVLYLQNLIAGNKNTSFTSVLFLVTSASLEQTSNQVKVESRIRVLSLIVFFYVIILTTSYRSGLYSILTSPGPRKYFKTVEEAFDAGLVVHTVSASQSFLEVSKPKYWERITKSNQYIIENNVPKNLAAVAINRTAISLTVSVARTYLFDFFYGQMGGAELVYEIPEEFFKQNAYIYISRGNPLTDILRRHIMYLQAGGMTYHWLDLILFEGFLKRKVKPYKKTPLNFSELCVIFYPTVILLLFSVIIFFVELYIYKGIKIPLKNIDH